MGSPDPLSASENAKPNHCTEQCSVVDQGKRRKKGTATTSFSDSFRPSSLSSVVETMWLGGKRPAGQEEEGDLQVLEMLPKKFDFPCVF